MLLAGSGGWMPIYYRIQTTDATDSMRGLRVRAYTAELADRLLHEAVR